MLEPLERIANDYADSLNAPVHAGAQVDPEAQLTTPVSNFIQDFCEATGIGTAHLFREAQLDGVKPDFDVRISGRQAGWIELKRPGHSLEGKSWRGREANQWALLSELDPLIVSDGMNARLYQVGDQVGEEVSLPARGARGWDPRPLEEMLRQFVSMRPSPIRRVSQLSRRLAPLARMLRDRIAAGLTPQTPIPAVRTAREVWNANVNEVITDATFADDLAQLISYSLAIASLEPGVDANQDRYISLVEARDVLRSRNGVLAAALGPVLEVSGLMEALRDKIGAIERLVSAVDQRRIASSTDSRGEPWLWFYEDFLAIYDPAARKAAGVFYTPTEVVRMQVRHVDHILRSTIRRRLGFGDKAVVTLDPAAGSGTYPLAVIDRAEEVAREMRGAAGPAQVVGNLADNLLAFELLPGPYAVAHLRIGQRLAEVEQTLTARKSPRVYLTDTLDDPDREVPTLNMWGDPELLAHERRLAQEVKRDRPVTVVLGNPPYKRRDRASGGGWVVHGHQGGRAIFDELFDAAKRSNVIFSAQASLYNDYLYFWRWALWKAFEQTPDQDAVVSFITGSSWLTGPAFVGLREIARAHADQMWIVDLGGEGRGAVKDENIFAIQTPVAIVTLYRKGKGRTEPAAVYYRRITGSAEQKLAALGTVDPPTADDPAWDRLESDTVGGVLVPSVGGEQWEQMPALANLFPWQQPGVKFNRAWPIAPSPDVLGRRWEALLAKEDSHERATLFVTAQTGRNIHTQVGDLPKLSELRGGAPHRAIVRYGYRSFDRQWAFDDPRLAALERPALWQSLSDRQLFLTSLMTAPLGTGPALTVTTAPPDLHHFSGRGGKDVVPLYRDAAAAQPNLPTGMLAVLEPYVGAVTPEDVLAYVYAVLAHPAYQQTFTDELATPGPRVPLTADRDLFNEAVATGARLLWLHTWGERFRSADRGPNIPRTHGWDKPVTHLPATPDDVTYEAETRTLHIGEGSISGVREEVWDFAVSGFPVLQRWLYSRTRKGVGRAASPKRATPLDRIRPTTWEDPWNDELLELLSVLTVTIDGYEAQAGLLERILAGPMISADDLPAPSKTERQVPPTNR